MELMEISLLADRCKKGEIDSRCRSYTSTDFLNYGGSVPGASEKYLSVQLKKKNRKQNEKQTNRVTKKTDKKQITKIGCSNLFISPIISKSHSFMFVMKDLGL